MSRLSNFGLRYVPTDYDAERNSKNVDQALAMIIIYLYESFPVREYADHDILRERIWSLFEEMDVVTEDEVERSGIHDAETGEHLHNWTSKPLLIPRSSL